MRALNSVHRLNGILRLFLCLAVIAIAILGVDESTAASSAAGNPPEIKAFSADPLTLKDGGSALYTFEVTGAANIQVMEAGAIIKEINSNRSSNFKGTARGRTTYQIRTGNINTFETMLIARNAGGEKKKALTLSFETKLPPVSASLVASGSDNRTGGRTPKWGPQSLITSSFTPATLTTRDAPQFTKCTDACNYCLRPDEAADRGFTQKCSEQLCYYSPDNQQKWYCYSKPVTVWCCKDGKVIETTKEQCTRLGGSYYATEAEATKVCRQMTGWYCSGGQVYQGTQAQAVQAGATWYTTQSQAMQVCQGWCCRDGQIGQTTQSQCDQLGGDWYATQSQALQACQQTGYCCYSGKLYQSTRSQCAQVSGNWYTSQSQAAQACQPVTYWCCSSGQVYQTTNYTSGCYRTQAEAQQACQSTCWCCAGGKVYQTSTAACTRAGGRCYSSQSQAIAGCRIILK